MHILLALLLSTLMQGEATPTSGQLLDCNDFTRVIENYQNPEALRTGEGVESDMWVNYAAKMPFAHTLKTEVSFWVSGKLSNVIATYGEYMSVEDGTALYDKLYAEFKECYPEAAEEENDYGPRNDLSIRLNTNLYARLTMYYYLSDDGEQEGWSVYFDISNLGM
ncbi:MAG: hypothetical protein R2794_10845 [Chitinophagales bacterium]